MDKVNVHYKDLQPGDEFVVVEHNGRHTLRDVILNHVYTVINPGKRNPAMAPYFRDSGDCILCIEPEWVIRRYKGPADTFWPEHS